MHPFVRVQIELKWTSAHLLPLLQQTERLKAVQHVNSIYYHFSPRSKAAMCGS